MSLLGIQNETIDISRLEPIVMDAVVQAALTCITAMAYVIEAMKRLYQMLKNIDIIMHVKHLLKLLITA